MNLEQKLLSLKMHRSETFPMGEYRNLNALISQKLARKEIYFSMKSDGELVTVTRIDKADKVSRIGELLAMGISEQLIEHGDNYRSLHVTIKKMNKQDLGRWSIVKKRDLVVIKRLE